MLIYDKIKFLAKTKNIPIYKIEQECDLAKGSICKWNIVSPSAKKLKDVADVLETTVDELLE